MTALLREELLKILKTQYGLEGVSVQFLREGGSRTFLVDGPSKYLLKVIGNAFGATARQSVSIMRYLRERDFPVPEIIATRAGSPLAETQADGETRLILLQEYIEGDEPDLVARAEKVGTLTGWLHHLLEHYPEALTRREMPFFIGRYTDILRRKGYPRADAYEELGETLWQRVCGQPGGNCHGDLHRGNLLEAPDGRLYVLDFDTACHAPRMFDVSVMCDMTNYFRLNRGDIDITKAVYERFLTGYSEQRTLNPGEERSFYDWVAIRHFQLQATIVELNGIDCIDRQFIDRQLDWLKKWLRAC